MGQVNVSVNGRSYRIACEDGQEERILNLARMVDARVAEMVSTVGQVGDTRLLVMASLLIADELDDTQHELELARTSMASSQTASFAVTGNLNGLAKRIEALAETIERT